MGGTKKDLTEFLMQRNKLEVVLMDDYTNQMFTLYDKAWEQIHTLMRTDSFLRFKDTIEYQEVVKKQSKNNKIKYWMQNQIQFLMIVLCLIGILMNWLCCKKHLLLIQWQH